MILKKFFSKCVCLVLNLLTAITFLLASNTALANVVNKVTLESPLFGESFVSAVLEGDLQDSCVEPIETSLINRGGMYSTQYSINIELEQQGNDCFSQKRPYLQRVFLGDIAADRINVSVYENGEKTLEQTFDIPEDVFQSNFNTPFSKYLAEKQEF